MFIKNESRGGREAFRQGRKEALLGNLYALRGAFSQQWKSARRTAGYATFILAGIPSVIILAWIARRTDNPTAITYIALGSSLMLMWTNAVFTIGWSLSDEKWSGLLDISLGSRTLLIVAMLGKALALSFFSLLTGAGGFIVVLLASGHSVAVANLPMALGSVAVTMFVMLCAGFIFCPITVLVGEPSGLFAAVMPFGVVCSGFLYPISVLPGVLQVIARGMPTSWAMEGLIMATTGSGTPWEVFARWGIALALAGLYLTATQFLFRAVERRVRVTAALMTY